MSAGQQAVPANNANNASNEGAQKKHMSKAAVAIIAVVVVAIIVVAGVFGFRAYSDAQYNNAAYRNFCGALDWFSLSVGGVGVSRGGVEFVPVDAGPVCGRDAVVRFGRRCLFALPQGVGDE